MNEDATEWQARPLAIRDEEPAQLPAEWTPSFVRSVDDQLAMLAERDRFYKNVLHPGVHYGVIPGTQKPSLWKPGAEALLSAMALHAETGNEQPPIADVTGNDHNGEPFIQYIRWCRIYRQTGPQMQDRIEIAKLTGSCNSWEPKYRYRDEQRSCPSCGGAFIIKGKQEYGGGWICFKKKGGCGAKFANDDPAIQGQATGKILNENVLELQNTILKMADKRALIAATLVATGCSDIFTQDVEDMPRTMGAPPEPPPPPTPRQPSRLPPETEAQIEQRRAKGIQMLHIWCRKNNVDIDGEKSEYRKLLLLDPAFAHYFEDPSVEVSSKALSLPDLQRFSLALQAMVKERDGR